ncbi:hypothetical protein GCM10007063_09680 [Lentibacillus kapialis]|uniref:DUF3794 domain-containing protein n=1 Tax=Lentibacillus kapialis TaxID=340214 RepID=A0A917PRC6_9BACI|nr:hypothetical protein [Lentibacillus kapialis]GGJ89099.1 hypothetical protein GCM10007063_09680 [Lentibacillus kapialis]
MRQRRSFYDMEDYYYQDDCCDKCGKKECGCERGELVEEVVFSDDVQKTAEFILPAALGPLNGGGALPPSTVVDALVGALGLTGLVNLRVNPDFTGIQQEVTVIKDKVINLGFIPATIDIEETTAGVVSVSIPIRIFFQEHTDCPGICPGDQVTETVPEPEAVLNQPLITTDASGGTVINFLLFKAVLRTNITVIRRGVKRNGKVEPLNPHRCKQNGMPVTINTPLNLTPNTTDLSTGGGGGGVTGASAPASNNANQ